LAAYIDLFQSEYHSQSALEGPECDGGAGAMEQGIKISISCLMKYKAKEKRERERRKGEKRGEVLANITETLA
jgi:hypothetical protein